MGFNWKMLLGVGKAVAAVALPGAVLVGIQQVEDGVKAIKSADKKKAAIEIAKGIVLATEGAIDKDVLNDPKVELATGHVVDAVVALNNAIAAAKAAKN